MNSWMRNENLEKLIKESLEGRTVLAYSANEMITAYTVLLE